MADPTPYPDLNAVLRDFVASVQAILGVNFCGAYHQGSFAVGDADEHSDVDFIVVTHGEVSDEQVDQLEAMQKRLYELDSTWAQHLEGSYFPKELLRRVDPNRAPLVYFDNGSTVPERDYHCNTAVVRWSLREHGVVLAGPDPKDLVEPVREADLRREVREAMVEFASWASTPTKAGGMSRWMQPYLVLNFCRMLQTLETGEIASKKAGGEWGLYALAPDWADLIQQALDDRPDPWLRVYQPADPAVAERTCAFIDYALRESAARFASD
ncbi:MAG: aminoglycoside adenylyltransferase domain-containing protein [Actinomycetota bacterium]